MSVNERLVSVDNTDPQFKWEGPWASSQGVTDDWSNQGPPFLGTLQTITASGSLTFSFRGRGVALWGSVRPRNTTGGSGRDPDWSCFIDGNDVGQPRTYPTRPATNFLLCWGEDITDGDHTLELRATVQSETLAVDQVQYQAASDVDISGAWTEADQNDGRYRYSDGWEEDDSGYRRYTYATNAWFTFEFTGEGIIFGGYTPGSPVLTDGIASYAVDGGQPTDFPIPATGVARMNQPYFTISGLKPGFHRLQVTNKGGSSTTPLGFTFMYVKNSPASTPQPESKPKNIGRIVGGAVGGGLGAILLAVLLVFAFVTLRSRRRKQKHETATARMSVVTEAKTGTTTVVSRDATGSTHASAAQGRLNMFSQPQYQYPGLQHHSSQTALPQTNSLYTSSTHASPTNSPPTASHSIPPNPAPPQPLVTQGVHSLYPAASFASSKAVSPSSPSSSTFTPQRRSPATTSQNDAWSSTGDTGRISYFQPMDGKADTSEFDPYAKDSKK